MQYFFLSYIFSDRIPIAGRTSNDNSNKSKFHKTKYLHEYLIVRNDVQHKQKSTYQTLFYILSFPSRAFINIVPRMRYNGTRQI